MLLALLSLTAAVLLKAQALTLLRGGTFITYNQKDESLEIISDGAMLFGNTILAISTSVDGLDSRQGEATVVDTTGKIISPGFIDTHRHTWQTAMRTTGPNIQLMRYLWTYGPSGPAALTFDTEDVYIGERMGMLEGLNAGVTTTVDHAHMMWSRAHVESALQGAIDSGARVFWCYAVQGVILNNDPYTVDYGAPADQLSHIHEISQRRPLGDGRVELGIAFDGFTYPGPMSSLVTETAKNLSLSLVTAHQVGTIVAVGGVITAANNLGVLNDSVPYVFSHASDISLAEANILRQFDQYVSITPESEMHYGHGNAHAHLIQDQASLGVDTHFTFSIDIITQMRVWLQSVRLRLYEAALGLFIIPSETPMSVHQAFLMGTRNGGLTLRRPDLGVLREGAVADVVVFSTDSIGLIGWSDPVAAIVLHSNVGDIDSVYVSGNTVKKDGTLVTDFVGEGLADRLRTSAAKWRNTLATTNLTNFQTGFQGPVPPPNFQPPTQVDVSRGPSTGFESSEAVPKSEQLKPSHENLLLKENWVRTLLGQIF